MAEPRTQTHLQEFLKLIPRGAFDQCWEWPFKRNVQGYGSIGKYATHRLSYLYHWGPIPEGMIICHECENPPCVNPMHLWAGTYSDNMRHALELREPYRNKIPAFALLPGGAQKFIADNGGSSALGKRLGMYSYLIEAVMLKQRKYKPALCLKLSRMGVALVDKAA